MNRPTLHDTGDAALGPVAAAVAYALLGHKQHVRELGDLEGCRQPGDTGTDNQDVSGVPLLGQALAPAGLV